MVTREFFTKSYAREEFLIFLRDFLPDDFEIKEEDFEISNNHINNLRLLGFCRSLELKVFEVEHSSIRDPRISITKEMFRILAKYGVRCALVVFKAKNSTNYRFSLIQFGIYQSTDRAVKKEFSNPKRFSYYLGPEAKVLTPYNYLIKPGKVNSVDDLSLRFSAEVVNKEFYSHISSSFLKLVGGTVAKGNKKEKHKQEISYPIKNDNNQTCTEFSVRLIGRIIFAWFLREKKSMSGIPLVSRDLLSLKAVDEFPNYYHSILEPLFFEVFNKPLNFRKSEFVEGRFSKIPYLNGGLFSPHENDFYSNGNKDNTNTVEIPNIWFKDFFELLELYNFTLDENTIFDEELSIDPEMLGRIFENLLAELNPETGESIRRSTGSFYTPRQIVDYMVDRSLSEYLIKKTNINREKIEALLTIDPEYDLENALDDEEKGKVLKSLEDLKILDPACGSGAYPIGALQKIVYVLQQVDPSGHFWFKKQIQNTSPELKRLVEKEFENKSFDYIRKLGVIRKNIYGVDIQPIATEISRLRCFLTLIVEEDINDAEENRGIEPLPNLDFKFVTANTLKELPKIDHSQKELFDNYEKIDELKSLRDQYFSSFGMEREQLKTQFVLQQNKLINQLIKEHDYMGLSKAVMTKKLTEWEPFSHKMTPWFDKEWMFGMKDGFDIIIGNPPYGLVNKKQNQKTGHIISESEVKLYKKDPIYKPAMGGMLNVYRLFICKSLAMLREEGTCSLIFPLAFMCDLSAANLRKYIFDQYTLKYIEAFPERDDPHKRVFEAVKMSVCILGITKKLSTEYEFNLRINVNRYVNVYLQPSKIKKSLIALNDPENLTIPLLNNEEFILLQKIRSKSSCLSKYGKCYTGEIDISLNKDTISDNPLDKALVKGAQIQKYEISDVISQGRIQFLNEAKYLKITNSDRSRHHLLKRIVMQGITGINEQIRLKMALLEPGTYCANSVNYIIPNEFTDPSVLLAQLNSSIVNWCFKSMSTNSNVNGYEVDNLPIINLDNDSKAQIVNLVKKLELTHKRNSQIYKDIDNILYNAYQLNEGEINIIERSAVFVNTEV